MVNVEISHEVGITLLDCMNYFFASLQDAEKIEDPVRKKDAELEYYKSIFRLQAVSESNMDSLIALLEELRIALLKEGNEEVNDVSVVEIVNDTVDEATTT